jgi:hypothetical protein
MASYNKFQQFVEDLAEKVHNLGADTLKVALTNSAPVNTNTVIANITQIANGNGYTTGGTQATISSSVQTSGTYKLVLADVVFTATGAVGPFQYAVLYNDTPTSPADPLTRMRCSTTTPRHHRPIRSSRGGTMARLSPWPAATRSRSISTHRRAS